MLLTQAAEATVYIIQNDNLWRQSLVATFQAANISSVSFQTGHDFLLEYQDRGPACLIIGHQSESFSAIDLLTRIREHGIHHPALLTAEAADVHTIVAAYRLGLMDCIDTPSNQTQVIEQIQKALEHDVFSRNHHHHKAAIADRLLTLTQRERTVLQQLLEGHANKHIAYCLKLSEKTVAAHRANLLQKMCCESLTRLVVEMASCDVLRDFRYSLTHTFSLPRYSLAA